MARLSKDDWAEIKREWEVDEREGHQWLADDLMAKGYEVNRAAIAKAAKRQGWSKFIGEKVTQNVTQSDKTSLKKVTQKPRKNVSTEASLESEWEEIDESQHGNSKYKQAHNDQAYRFCLLRATDKQLAKFFGTSEQTINNWKSSYPDFFESIKSAKMWADAEVAAGLFKRATGYRYSEVKTRTVRPMSESDEDGGIQASGDDSLLVVEVVTSEKEVPPVTKTPKAKSVTSQAIG